MTSKEQSNLAELPDGPPDATGLTYRQQRILGHLRDCIEQRGYPPSMREIGTAVGLTSTSSVAHQLKVLEQKGFIKRDPHPPARSRGLPARGAQGPQGDQRREEVDYDETGIGDSRPEAHYVPLVGTIAAGAPILPRSRPRRSSPCRASSSATASCSCSRSRATR